MKSKDLCSWGIKNLEETTISLKTLKTVYRMTTEVTKMALRGLLMRGNENPLWNALSYLKI